MNRFVRSASRAVVDIRHAVEESEECSLEEAAVRSCWQRSSGVSRRYLIYRWFQFCIHLAILGMSILEIGRHFNPVFEIGINAPRTAKFYVKWLLYLTHWGLAFNAVQAFLGAFLVQKAFKVDGTSTPVPVSRNIAHLYHILYTVSVNLSAFIATAFWLWVYDPADTDIDTLTVSEHGVGTFLLVLDLFIISLPYKLFYVMYTMIVPAVYMLMSYVHYLCGALDRFQFQTFMYEKIDWNYPKVAWIYYSTSVILVLIFNTTLWVLYLARRVLQQRIRLSFA